MTSFGVVKYAVLADNPDSVIIHNVVAMRAEPRSGSEQVSQVVLNDFCTWLEDHDEYTRIRTADAYEGWVLGKHVVDIDKKMREALPLYVAPYAMLRVCEPIVDAYAWSNASQPLTKFVFGTRLRKVTETPDHCLTAVAFFGGGGALVASQCLQSEETVPAFSGEHACRLGMKFIGTPYLWGGTTPFGFDCSGFVQRIYGAMNVILPRDAHMQADSPLGSRLETDNPTQAGDLVFFRGQSDPRMRGITHVGMALDAQRFVHAVGKEGVIITPFDDPYYSAQYTYCSVWRYRP